MKMWKKTASDLPDFRREISSSDLGENETQDNVSMHHVKNTLTASVRQVGKGGMHNGEEG